MKQVKCPKCGKLAPIIEYGAGYVAACCGEVLYNEKEMPKEGKS